MLHRILILLLLSPLATSLMANMASPIQEGTLGGRTFISKHVDVMSESIFIQPDSTFTKAFIRAKYHIKADTSGLLIPLLFHANEYDQGIVIRFNNQIIDINNYFSADYNHLTQMGIPPDDKLLIKWDENDYLYEDISDLKYFEVDMTKGVHTIEISYYADAWVDRGEWFKNKSFRYSLSPIKYWKSVGDIAVTIDFSKIAHLKATINTNLGPNYQEEEPQRKTWVITAIDQEYINIMYLPVMSTLSKALIKISPAGIALLAMLLFIFLHIRLVKSARSYVNFTIFAGSLLVPALSYLVYFFAYELIDQTLGDDASRFHGYTFLTVVFVPFVMIFYALLVKWYSKTLPTR